jgi:hypothetical protein
VLTLVHARQALGLPRALVEVGTLAAYGYALERIGLGVFRAHDYGTAWRLAPGGVPLAVAAVWASVILSALTLAARRGMPTAARRAVAAALIAVTLDLLIEPVAVRRGLWAWTPGPGSAFRSATSSDGVLSSPPGASVRSGSRSTRRSRAWRSAAPSWRRRRSPRCCSWAPPGRRSACAGWLAAASVWLATLLLLGRRRPAGAWPDSLGGRLGATPGLGPESVMMLLAAGFAADALDAGRPVHTVAAAALAVVAFVGVASGRFAFSDTWRREARGRFTGVQDLVRVLMKPPNGQPWTDADRALLRAELRALARLTPGFVLFLLPGGMVLLVVYAHVLDRRRLKRPASDEP